MRSNQTQSLFEEDTAPPLWLMIGGLAEMACGLAMVILAALFVADELHGAPQVIVITAGSTLMVIGAVVASSRIKISITTTKVRLSYGLIWRCEVDRSDIGRVVAIELRPSTYGGLGLRMLPGTRALFFTSGRGIRIDRVRDAPTLRVRSRRTEDIIQLLGSE